MQDPNIARKNIFQNQDLLNSPGVGMEKPIFSHIELSSCGLCNRKCSFCPRSNPAIYPSKNEFLEPDLFQSLLSDLRDNKYSGRLSFSGFSEPLLHPELSKLIALAREFLPSNIVEIVSNGDLLTSEIATSLFKAGLTTLLVSMYDGPKQINMFNSLFKDAGINPQQYILRERYLPAQDHFGLTFSNRAGSVASVREVELPLKKQCFYTHYRMMVDHNGDVLLCPHDWQSKLVVGNISLQSIYSIWFGEKLQVARDRLGRGDRKFEPCKSCDVDGTLQGKKHYEAWSQLGSSNNF